MALTNKLLRMVNTAHYQQRRRRQHQHRVARGGAGRLCRHPQHGAVSLVLLEHMNDKAHAGQLKEEFLRALMAGSLASELVPRQRDGEEAFIGAMFQNLGRLLTEFYLPEEARQIRAQLTAARGQATGQRSAHAHAERPRSVTRAGPELRGSRRRRGVGLGPARDSAALHARPTAKPPAAPATGRRAGCAGWRWLRNEMTDAMLARRATPRCRRALAAMAAALWRVRWA